MMGKAYFLVMITAEKQHLGGDPLPEGILRVEDYAGMV